MRVCGYHILFELSKEDHAKLRDNKPITDTVRGQELLGRAIAGDHVGILEEVRIGGHGGTNIKVTPMQIVKAEPTKQKSVSLVVAIEESKLDEAPTVDPKAVAASVVVAKQGNARQQKAKALWETTCFPVNGAERKAAATELLAFKKAAKVSWATLGLPDTAGTDLTKLLG